MNLEAMIKDVEEQLLVTCPDDAQYGVLLQNYYTLIQIRDSVETKKIDQAKRHDDLDVIKTGIAAAAMIGCTLLVIYSEGTRALVSKAVKFIPMIKVHF